MIKEKMQKWQGPPSRRRWPKNERREIKNLKLDCSGNNSCDPSWTQELLDLVKKGNPRNPHDVENVKKLQDNILRNYVFGRGDLSAQDNEAIDAAKVFIRTAQATQGGQFLFF